MQKKESKETTEEFVFDQDLLCFWASMVPFNKTPSMNPTPPR